MRSTIHVGFGIDQNFGAFAGITITSLAYNNQDSDLVVHIIYDHIRSDDMERLQRTAQMYRNLTLQFYKLTITDDMTFVVPAGHITQAMYYRYLFADMLPSGVTKLIYLDADIICKGSLLSLWQTDLQGHVLGAVRDWGEEKSCGRIGLTSGRYFNSGVLLIDLDKWRKRKLTNQLFSWLQDNSDTKILWGDQDALNGVVDGDFLELDKRYNCIIVNNTLLEMHEDDVIVHYIDYVKPWHVFCLNTPEKELYWKYVGKSLWDDLKPKDGNTVNTTVMSARVLCKEGKYEKSISYYEALLKYFLKEDYT